MFKYIYWAWLVLCFLFWIFFSIFTSGVTNNVMINFFNFIFKWRIFGNDFREVIFLSPLVIPFVFIIASVIRMKVNIWEMLVILAIWAMVIYVFPHLRT